MRNPRIWTADEDTRLGTMADGKLAAQLGCTRDAVYQRRWRLKIPPLHSDFSHNVKWGTTELALFDWYSDVVVAQMTGRALAKVKAKRTELRNGSK